MVKYKLLSIMIMLALLSVVIPYAIRTQPVAAAVIEFEPFMDTFIYDYEPTTPQDGSGLRAGWKSTPGAGIWRSIMQFAIEWDVDIPLDATIVEATLTIYPYSDSGDSMTLLAQGLRRLDCDEDDATWQEYKSGSSWTTAGAASSTYDYRTTCQASASYGADSQPVEFDVTCLVDRALQYEEDMAFRIVAETETQYEWVAFGDHEGPYSSPVLSVQYSYEAAATYPPTVATGSYSDVTSSTAKLYGTISYVDNGLAIYEDFEWGNDGDDLSDSGGIVTWSQTAAGSSSCEIDTAQHYGSGTRSALFYRDGTNTPRANFAYSAMGSTEILSVRVRKDDASRLVIFHGDGTKFINCGIYESELVFYNDGSLNYPGESVTTGSWNLFEITDVNWSAGTYDIYLNGWWVCTADMRVGGSYSNTVWFYNYAGTSSCWVDNVGFHPYVAERGFQYGLTQTPTWTESEDGLFGTGQYDLTIEGLSGNTEYWYRAFVSNEEGTAYGNWASFSTVGPPSITTVAASNVASTSARLNSALSDDGGDDCTIKFGWGLSSESAIEDYDSSQTLAGTYNTGQYPYLDVSGLLPDYTYYFRVSATNDAGTTLGSELTFETELAIAPPSNFVGYPEATSISLSWSKGSGSTNTLVRYGTSSYPSTNTSGTLAYFGPSSTYTVDDLTSGKTYYFSAWGESGGNYSANYTTLMMTTSASAGDDVEDIDIPGQPSRWFSAPDYTTMSGLGLIYDGYNSALDAGNVPRATGWFLGAIFLSALFGLIAYLRFGKKMMIGMIVLTVCLAMGYFLKIIPWWIPLMTLILTIVWSQTHKQVEHG